MSDIVHEAGAEQSFGMLFEYLFALVLERLSELKNEQRTISAELFWVLFETFLTPDQHHPDSDSTRLIHKVVMKPVIFGYQFGTGASQLLGLR